MQHIAIMHTSWGLTQKILDGRKVIESRWYKNRTAPWGNIYVGDDVYFKNAGEPVALKATVERVASYSNVTPQLVRLLLQQYGEADGIDFSDLTIYYDRFKDKRFCLFIFLTDIHTIPPLRLNKQGFGAMAAWITVPSIEQLIVG